MQSISERTQLGAMKRRCGDLGRKKERKTITAHKKRGQVGNIGRCLLREHPAGGRTRGDKLENDKKSKSVTSHHRVSTCFGLECSPYAAAPCCHGHRCFCLRCPPRLRRDCYVVVFCVFHADVRVVSRAFAASCANVCVSYSLLERCTAEVTCCAFYDVVIITIAFVYRFV